MSRYNLLHRDTDQVKITSTEEEVYRSIKNYITIQLIEKSKQKVAIHSIVSRYKPQQITLQD